MVRPRHAKKATRPEDEELLQAAQTVARARYRRGWHSIGAALRGTSGRVYAAVNMNAKYVGRVDVCAEAIALGMGIAAGEKGFEAIVAVQQPRPGSTRNGARIVPPCGICREMLNDYAPHLVVLMPGPRGHAVRRKVRDLLPDRYEDP